MRQCFGQPCQKQPSMKRAKCSAGKMKSGQPGMDRCRRHPVMPADRRMTTSFSSVSRFPFERTAAITCERFVFENVSAMARAYVLVVLLSRSDRTLSVNCSFLLDCHQATSFSKSNTTSQWPTRWAHLDTTPKRESAVIGARVCDPQRLRCLESVRIG